jgi:hypothetical protein
MWRAWRIGRDYRQTPAKLGKLLRGRWGLGIIAVATAAALVIGIVLLLPGGTSGTEASGADTSAVGNTVRSGTTTAADDKIGAAVNGAGSSRTHEPHPDKQPAGGNKLPAPPMGMNGCDPAYGGKGQCVPWHIPPTEENKCAFLKGKGLSGLKVNGKDRLDIDRTPVRHRGPTVVE